jgi:SpoVK/Ycf46/Vps4 family AAA+-type ATPase
MLFPSILRRVKYLFSPIFLSFFLFSEDLQNVCREAALAALRRDLAGATISKADFEAVLRVARPSVPDLSRYAPAADV